MNDFAKVYGSALYSLAQEEHLEDVILNELTTFCALLKDHPDYSRLLDSRNVPKDERTAMLDIAFTGRVNEYLLDFMKILCERNAFGQLSACCQAYVKYYNDDHGIVPAAVVSATPMTQEQIDRLVEALEKKSGKKVQVTVSVDPGLGGGLRVEMEGYRYDNTVSARMDQLRKTMLSLS